MRPLGRVYGALVGALVWGLLSTCSAGATTVSVGQLFTPLVNCGNDTFLQTGVAAGTPYAVPKAGVISSWSFEDAATVAPGLKLKVGRYTGGGTYMIIADAAAGSQVVSKINTYPAHIPVKAGDVIGLFASGGPCGNTTSNPGDAYLLASGDVAPGPPMLFGFQQGAELDISVRVALDCVVPKVTGETVAAAKQALTAASCRSGKVTSVESSGKPGIVISQAPSPGRQLSPGFPVKLTISSS